MGNFCALKKVGYYLPVDNIIVALNVIHCVVLGYFLRFDKWVTAQKIIHTNIHAYVQKKNLLNTINS